MKFCWHSIETFPHSWQANFAFRAYLRQRSESWEGVTVWILALQDREVTIITLTIVNTMFLGWCFIGSSRTSIRVTAHLLGLHAPATDLVRAHFRTFLSVPRSCIVRRLLSPVVTDLLTSKAEIENVSAPTKPKQFFCSSRKKSFHFSFFKWCNNKGSNRWFFKRAWMDEISLKGKN